MTKWPPVLAFGRPSGMAQAFASCATSHGLLFGLVPNRPWTGTSLWPRGLGPLF